jgi:DNA primase
VAGRIRNEDIALVRERLSIVDVISEHVTLKSAGGNNLKGLCPFHDEKTASFTVAPARGVYFCHGCSRGGDALRFLMELEHLSFVEAVEYAAGKVGVQLRYEEAGSAPVRQTGVRQRLLAAHVAAAEFYAGQLASPDARPAREFLAQRGFDRTAAEHYGCGFAPPGWDLLTKHLRQVGFTNQELVNAGLAREARSGSMIDRFRRRLLWPIKDLAGEVIGFGARKIFDDDDGPKYLNTPETALYKKSHVLYGLDQAKREIAKQGRAVIVEGYTDVMACHLAGVPVAVATCATAFGPDHIGVLRRLILDSADSSKEIIFTFDGDAAGQKAAVRAFSEDQRFVAQTFIAISPDNMDPCELRLSRGDLAVRDLVAQREPLLDFVLRSVLSKYNLDTAEGRVTGLRATAPLVAQIKDPVLRSQYIMVLSGKIGMEPEEARRAVYSAAKGEHIAVRASTTRTLAPDHPQAVVERECLKIALQEPALAGPMFDAIDSSFYEYPPYIAVRDAIAKAGGVAQAGGGPVWFDQVTDECGDLAAQPLIPELAVEPLHLDREPDPSYVEINLTRLQLPAMTRQIEELKSRLQRVNPVKNPDEYRNLFGELVGMEARSRGLRDRAARML